MIDAPARKRGRGTEPGLPADLGIARLLLGRRSFDRFLGWFEPAFLVDVTATYDARRLLYVWARSGTCCHISLHLVNPLLHRGRSVSWGRRSGDSPRSKDNAAHLSMRRVIVVRLHGVTP